MIKLKCKHYKICKIYDKNGYDCNNERYSLRCGHFRLLEKQIKEIKDTPKDSMLREILKQKYHLEMIK